MLIRIDQSSMRPLFEQVAAAVRAEIVSGRIRPGDRLPSAREVGDALDINPHTVLHAYQVLRSEELVDLRRGRGAVVSEAAGRLVELQDQIHELVMRAGSLGLSRAALAALLLDPRSESEASAQTRPAADGGVAVRTRPERVGASSRVRLA